MGSGLDDYPRREKESEVAKEHVDLVSWLYLFSKSLAEMAKYLKSKENNQFLDQIKNINSNER